MSRFSSLSSLPDDLGCAAFGVAVNDDLECREFERVTTPTAEEIARTALSVEEFVFQSRDHTSIGIDKYACLENGSALKPASSSNGGLFSAGIAAASIGTSSAGSYRVVLNPNGGLDRADSSPPTTTSVYEDVMRQYIKGTTLQFVTPKKDAAPPCSAAKYCALPGALPPDANTYPDTSTLLKALNAGSTAEVLGISFDTLFRNQAG